MKRGITYKVIEKDGDVKKISIRFGPHFYVNIENIMDKVIFNMGATHHGFTVDATKVDGELEKVINCVRDNFQNKLQD
jgi:hypothetical protein